jgi:proteic killer suppression protein
MDVRHEDQKLDRVEFDRNYTAGLSPGLVKAFRKTMQSIRAAVDERDLRARRAARFEKLSGRRSDQHSVRLNDQFRLIIEMEGTAPSKTVVIVGIEDYH